MNCNIQHIKHYLLPGAFFTATVLVAIISQQSRDWLLPVLFLLLPFADFLWQMPRIEWKKWLLISWLFFTVTIIVLLYKNSEILDVFTMMVLLAALPEEWFFRGYLQKRLGNTIVAILLVSLMFSFMHFITHNSAAGWLVFAPSVLFGWIYKKTGDLILVIILHALSNLLYFVFFQDIILWHS